MFNLFTRIASLVLAFGFFFSCSTLQSSNESAATSKELSVQQIRQRIDSIEKKINEGSQNPTLYYQKGNLLAKLARKQDDPTERTSLYNDARNALSEAATLYGEPNENEKVQQLLKVTWSNEHNQGVQILQSDTSKSSPDYTRAAAHFKNATTVIPDSAISYRMGARAYYKNQQPLKAIGVLEEARRNIDPLPSKLLEQLAFLYLENNMTQDAIKIYEQAESFSGQNLNLLHGLSNAYINAGKHRKAVDVLRTLLENEPKNVIYTQSLATELYFVAANKLDMAVSNLQQGQTLDSTAFPEADSLLHEAETHFKRLLNENTEDQELKLSSAKFYQNSATKYQQILPFVNSENKDELETQIKKYLSSSIPLLEQLAEKSPDKKQIWHNLYQAYSYLGMEEKAQNVKSNF